MSQFIAGNILDNLYEVFEDLENKNAAHKLSNWLSHFQFTSKSNFEKKKTNYDSNFAVAINLLQRGLPTKLNYFALNFLVSKSDILSFNENDESAISLKFIKKTKEIESLFFRSLHIIDPRIKLKDYKNSYQKSWEKLDSEFEEKFFFETLPGKFGKRGDYVIQLFALQRSIESITSNNINSDKLPHQINNNFKEQRTDFSIEYPYYKGTKSKGFVIEIDGTQHQNPQQQILDIERDKAVSNSGWSNTLRIKTSDIKSNKVDSTFIMKFIDEKYLVETVKNYLEPIWVTNIGSEVLQLTLIPFGIARIQRAFIEYLAHNILNYQSNQVIKIAVLERDVPCAKIAFEDLYLLLDSISKLKNDQVSLPNIELEIFSTTEFIQSKFQNKKAKLISEFDNKQFYDLLIDISVLDRNENPEIISTNAEEIITIRSVHYITAKRKIATNELIKYKPFCEYSNDKGVWEITDDKFQEGINYLLNSIFRKKEFRTGQLPIMHNALQCKSVIGLLPTGGGKSLTYQLSALLQPGICIVIDPIRSLMKDQVDGLNRNLIDNCLYINSTMQGEEKRNAMKKLIHGEIQFLFISPERLQMEDFRTHLTDMFNNGHYFSYCVIDEAHCVSEWGHDFRTAYLRLGENAINFCKTKNLESLPLFALTATASYDVLADVQRELSGNNELRRLSDEAIIRSEYSKRDELQFVVEEVSFPLNDISTIWDLKNVLGEKKQERTLRLLDSIPQKINEIQNNPSNIFNKEELSKKDIKNVFEKLKIKEFAPNQFYKEKNAGLIFCPHTKGLFGVTDKFQININGAAINRKGYYDSLLYKKNIKAGFFMGSGNDSETSQLIEVESFDNQDKFINNELNLMVATKAFGMGIDKENIRFTIHVNYPSSIESFVQEAGRAGRDRKLALSYILFNEQEVRLPKEEHPINHDLDINRFFHKNSFKGIQKELTILDELLTEIHFPDRTFEIENHLSQELDIDIKCGYYEKDNFKGLFFNQGFEKKLGYLNLVTLSGVPKDSIDNALSNKIFASVINYIKEQNLKEPVFQWLLKSENKIGITEILKSKKNGEQFAITVSFENNIKDRIKTLSNWLNKALHAKFNESLVLKMKGNCTDAAAFIEDVCENYQKFTGNKIDLEEFCNNRDIQRGVKKGTGFSKFMELYNGYRDKQDTEKAIYRLSTLGIIEDYTVNFSTRTFNIIGTKKSDKEHKEILRQFLCKYYSEKTTDLKLKALSKINEQNHHKKQLNFLVNFVYSEIQKKRLLALQDIKFACRLGIEKGSIELKDYIDLYFNSKYARTGYSYINEKGKEIIASLPDITNNGKEDNIKWVWKFIEIVDEDPKAGQINNIKHLRGACVRMLSNQPDSYTLLLLNAFTLYMLEYNNLRYLKEAENIILHAFTQIIEKENKWNENKIEEIYNQFTEIILNKNPQLKVELEKYNLMFDLNNIMLKNYLQPILNAKATLIKLNEILN